MKLKTRHITLDKFIDEALYSSSRGYYMNKDPFGIKGDFITSPNISILFSEMIAIWTISFWQKLKCPKKINLIDLGSGNGEMIFDMISTFQSFQLFKKSCKIFILEKSSFLKKIQKKKLKKFKIKWIKSINEIKSGPNIFLANEFFDALPVKQFFKINNEWKERYVDITNKKKPIFVNKKTNIKKFEKKIGIKLSNKQNVIEFSPLTMKFIKQISKKLINNNGGLLIIDYGYLNNLMKNSLQAVKNHKNVNILKYYGHSDITHKINFKMIAKMFKYLNLKSQGITTQRNFLINLGILQRAEIISKNLSFQKKADIYYRLKRLIDKEQMGNLFKVMLITNNKINFQTGF